MGNITTAEGSGNRLFMTCLCQQNLTDCRVLSEAQRCDAAYSHALNPFRARQGNFRQRKKKKKKKGFLGNFIAALVFIPEINLVVFFSAN